MGNRIKINFYFLKKKQLVKAARVAKKDSTVNPILLVYDAQR